MLLKNLIKDLSPDVASIKIRGVSFDSRTIKKGELFVSIKGSKFDGDKFIDDACKKGASAIVHSKNLKKINKSKYIKVKDTREILANISNNYYKKKPKNIIAVTGTNGKTSISDFFCQIFLQQKKKSGFIGTLGFRKNKILKRRNLTTLDPFTLNKDLNDMKLNGINDVIIEASSHGLKQKRLDFLNLKAGIFTNLSHDHLDYHKTMKDYLNAKLLLFKKNLSKGSFMITDTDMKQFKILKKLKEKKKLKLYTIGSKSNIFKIHKHSIYKNLQVLEIEYKNKIYKLKINLYGSIQIKNLLMAILASKSCGLKIENIFSKIHRVKSVEGRLELIRTLPNKSKIFLDYAHTPDALQNAILSLRQHFNKKITVIFGCGGERDKMKRGKMGKVAKKYCNKIYLTDDNPRNENANTIRSQIKKGLKGSSFKEIGNRKKAIIFALRNSKPDEVILIAGKGHENYQYIGNKKIYLNDKEIVKKFKINKNNFNKKNETLKFNAEILKKILGNKKNYLFNGASINSKKIKNRNLFIALKGRKKDGHDFLKEAKVNGASYCVISKKLKKSNNFIKVKNTMFFMNELAKNIRDNSSAKFIGVTGSSGKTTLKTMVGNILKKYSKTYFSPHSYNNQYGVPISICNMNFKDNFGVFEVGMSKKGEIHKLSSLLRPDIAIITNVAEAHLENFKNINGIAKAKAEIIYNIKKNGTVILNKDDKFFDYFKKIAEKNKIKILSYGYSKEADIFYLGHKKKRSGYKLKISVNKKIIFLNIINNNKNYIMNILSSIAVLEEFDLDLKKVQNFFKKQTFLEGRGKISEIKRFNKKFFLIDESYNANPLSVKSAIENFSNIKKNQNKKYFLFGDMLELGKNSKLLHKRISNIINKSDIDKTFVYGKKSIETYKYLNKNKKGVVLKNLSSFDNKISKLLKNGDFLMIKASNAMKLHKLSKKLLGGRTNAL